MRPRGTFLLGAGCQKGGTSWLYRYLQGSPQFSHGYRKEYHVFDTRDLPEQHRMRDRILGQAAEAVARAQRGEPADAEVLHRASMYADPELYFDYFTSLLTRRPRFRLTADFTPESGLLSAERLSSIREGFARRRVRARAVYLMRDPVARVLSQVRMQAEREPGRFDSPPEEVLARVYAEPVYDMRTRYDRTIANLDRAFPDGEVHYAFYEELFTDEAVRAICAFAGIDFHEPDFATRRNASSGSGARALPEETQRRMAEHYRDVYRFVADRFGRDLTEIWPSSRFVL